MDAPTSKRRNGREWALQMIVQADLNPFVDAEKILNHFWEQQWSFAQEAKGKEDNDLDEMERTLQPSERLATSAVREFAEAIVRGVLKNIDDLDALIATYCENWSLQRLGVIERCVLRLAFYEIRTLKTPAPVVINEAVDLAKYFSNAESGAFVNGVLDRFAKREARN
ncbi:MAG: transcription antitermination factor NusB [bacterium]|nr:transcription antitermination factor NusB [bacterium]MDO5462797.1 transcription antitermination factor NusB [bacterium]